MSQKLRDAIMAFVTHVREYEEILISDTAALPSNEERTARIAAKRAVCDNLESFAERSIAEPTTFREFEDLRQRNHDVFIAGNDELIRAISSEFYALNRLD